MHAGATAEWHPLRHVMVHEPGIEVFFALLAPSAHLYERFFHLDAARREHRELARLLHEEYGVRLTRLDEIITRRAESDGEIYRELTHLAGARCGRRCEGDACDLRGRIRGTYERPLPLGERDAGHLLTIAMLDPTVVFTPEGIRTELSRPLHNLYFMRDQQIATAAGMVQAKMAHPERSGEVDLAGIALAAAGAAPVHRIRAGSLEGGDFLPAGDFALVGCGARTTREGISDLLAFGAGCDEVAIVHQPQHPLIHGRDPMVNMHLDTYVNIAGEGIAVGNPELLAAAEVEIVPADGDAPPAPGSRTTLDRYLREKGYAILGISTLEQLCYATNFLCVRDGECIAPDVAGIVPAVLERLTEKAARNPAQYGALLDRAKRDRRILAAEGECFPKKGSFGEYGLEMTPVSLTNATGGYGGAHCMTCVLRRG
jgi:arginine deiminase